MSPTMAGVIFIVALVLALAPAYRPLGDYMYRVGTPTRHPRGGRGFAREVTGQLGNFWVDLVRISLRILLPIAVIGAIVLIAGGAIQNLSGGHDITTIAGATQHLTGGPVASQEAIKELGTNGGG